MYKKVSSELVHEIQQITVFHARKKKIFYKDVMKKVIDKLQAWKGKLLSFGGKAVLINSVLQSNPVYLLSAMVPSKCVIKELHKLFNRFFWQTKEDGKCKHWSEWNKLCYPNGEGGLGFKSLNDISRALFSKLWWRLKTNSALNDQPQFQAYKDDSVEDLAEIMEGDHWDMAKVRHLFCEEMVQLINSKLGNLIESQEIDKPHWMLTSSGKFSVSNAWVHKAKKADFLLLFKILDQSHQEAIDHLFLIGPFAMKQAVPAFILWQLWKGRNIRRHGGTITVNQVIYEINRGILVLAQSLFPDMKQFPKRWPFFVQYLENLRMTFTHKKVTWVPPERGRYKCNTDGASRGNPGISSAAFCIRDQNGDLVYAAGKRLEDTTNVIAEAVAIEDGIQYCVDHQLLPLIVETDSLTMQKILDGIWEIPCSFIIFRKFHLQAEG
ncbi:uncharacterized protein LOC132639457 [Lycium barbarum]|uniref:uncharacterized protein LOC132639457 n=1 Tax=Lycium barbarum TaxID=112863 RepID=UPI00293ED724|nr:uncharacterized protein LOC132639457 [Lycium barbarum]